MTLTNNNYFSPEATKKYWSVSLFKEFDRCEACGLASVRGLWRREETTSLLVGSYVDAYFSDELDDFCAEHPEIFNSRTGKLKSDFAHADDIIYRVRMDDLMMDYLTGEYQTIMSAEMFGVPWKIKMDVYNEKRIVDLKVVKDFEDIYDKGYGWRSWIEYWGYDIQGAVYQRIEQLVTGRDEPLPFYLAAVTKEKYPDIKVIQIPQHILDTALKMVEAKIERFDLIKQGEVEPIRCNKCDYCKSTKKLTKPEVYEIKEAQ
jgi:hypothetical protein